MKRILPSLFENKYVSSEAAIQSEEIDLRTCLQKFGTPGTEMGSSCWHHVNYERDFNK